MPVRNKALSEYKKKFRWHDSVKSPSFRPSPEQKLPSAGLSSADFGHAEPPLQHKRYPLPADNKVTYTTKQIFGDVSGSDDDIGKRKGRPGGGVAAVTPLKTYKVSGSGEAGTRPHKGTRIKPTREPVKNKINTSARPKPANGNVASEDMGLGGDKETNVNNSRDAGSQSKKDNKESTQHAAKPAHKHAPKPNVALQYQAGIKDTRPKSAKYLSEYQRNYEWRNALPKESPLMAAEQMVYKSNANVAPFVPDKIPRQSEYKVQFRDWSPIRHKLSTHQQQLRENAEREIKAKYRLKTKSKKSKRTSLTPDKMRPAGVPSVYSHDDLHLLKSAENPTKPFFPHSTTIRRWKSEYSSNFKEPGLYHYENGIWRGADPPHVAPKDDSSVGKRQQREPSDAKANWFTEVLELRQKAEDYRKRAQGTHFSREHVAQILANQARLWDESSTATSTVSSLSAPSVDNGLKGRKQDSQPAPVTGSHDSPPVRRRLAWPQKNDNEDKTRQPQDVRNGDPQPLDNGDQESSIGSIPTPEGYKGSVTPSSDEVETIDEQGRLPTPRLREEGLSKRHHLDRTTPATGGAILTSPEPKRRSPSPPRPAPVKSSTYPAAVQTAAQDHRRNVIPGAITRGFAYDSDEDTEDEHSITPRVATPPPQPELKTRVLDRVQGSPTAGVTTRDPLPLRENGMHPPPFQRHSNNFFETSPAIPVMPRKIGPPRTWAAPQRNDVHGEVARDAVLNGQAAAATAAEVTRPQTVPNGTRHEATQAAGAKGPLDRPNSGSMHGRPMTAYPQTRQEAGSNSNQGATRSLSDDRRQDAGNAPRKRGEAWTVPADQPRADVEPNTSPAWRSPARDSDELSLSTMSIASSSSLASEVLERARKRRDDFWGK